MTLPFIYIHSIIPRIYEHIPLHGQRNFADGTLCICKNIYKRYSVVRESSQTKRYYKDKSSWSDAVG